MVAYLVGPEAGFVTGAGPTIDGVQRVVVPREWTRHGGCSVGNVFCTQGVPGMKITRTGSAAWQGGLKDGRGSLSTESGALKTYPYGFASRFEGVRGSNPEELIGAAHSGCFTMALSMILGEAGLTAEQMDTAAQVTLESVDGGFAITKIHLTLKAKIPGTDQATFSALAAKAKAGCPVSKLFKAEITLDASLV
ncbi:Osmotically inducible protein C [Fimbriiglobus ruber]|uniref:Osmotically inducible protein C n=2 Tax=Fimbriiglobus ruber TaxID=1908690 RepID=A0A225DVP3_9BACT|nr:Osmotically inducible protein C [Fimbriiglobus ruber]